MLFLISLFGLNTQAHHSSNPHFDKDLKVNVTGTITELKLVNPHAYIYFDVDQDGEMANWRCELSSATQLRRWGWTKEIFAAGEVITVNGNPARREDNVCFLNSMTLSNGQVVNRNGDLSEGVKTEQIVSTEPRSQVLANGQPNIQGPWLTLSFGRNAKEGIKPTYVSSQAGEAAMEGYEMAFDDPILQCNYLNLINGWIHDAHVNDIVQSDDKVLLKYGFMDVVRTVHLGLDSHPQDLTPSYTGHSIGKWEGDTLVVNTVGIQESVLNHFDGQKHSDQVEVIERFRVDPETTRLYRDYTLVDPLYLVGESTGQDVAALSNESFAEFGCVELSGKNNIRPTDERYDQIDASGVIATADNVQLETQQTVETIEETASEAAEAIEQTTEEEPWWQFW